MKEWLSRLLFDWVFRLLYKLLVAFLRLVDLVESFFDVFAGTSKIWYKGEPDFLINVFFGHDAVTNAFWAMALIAVVIAFGGAIFMLARKVTDITDSVKQTVGQIVSNFIRSLFIIILLNALVVAAVNITNVLLDRINYALENAAILDQPDADKTFTEEEYATMTRILATVANYSVNPSASSRYNINSCFNAVRPDLQKLDAAGVFDYEYPKDANGHYTWQGALQLLAISADLNQDLSLSTYYEDVVSSFNTIAGEIKNYPDFAPVQTAYYTQPATMDTDVLIFLITSMEAAENQKYNQGTLDDPLRRGYTTGDKDYRSLSTVRKDFDIWDIDYLVGYVSSIVFIIIMCISIFTFIVRLFNILLLYITAPLFAGTIPMDDGGKWQAWVQSFVIQLFSGFGMVIAMRLYLIIIPVVISSELVFFANSTVLNNFARLLMVLGGAWAVLHSGNVITGILAGNPGMAAIQQEGAISQKVSGWAMRAPGAAIHATKAIGSNAVGAVKGAYKAGKTLNDLPDRYRRWQAGKADAKTADAQRYQNKADSYAGKADRRMAEGKGGWRTDRLLNKSAEAQKDANDAQYSAERHNARAGRGVAPEGRRAHEAAQRQRYQGFGSDSMPSEPKVNTPQAAATREARAQSRAASAAVPDDQGASINALFNSNTAEAVGKRNARAQARSQSGVPEDMGRSIHDLFEDSGNQPPPRRRS